MDPQSALVEFWEELGAEPGGQKKCADDQRGGPKKNYRPQSQSQVQYRQVNAPYRPNQTKPEFPVALFPLLRSKEIGSKARHRDQREQSSGNDRETQR